MNGPSFPVIRSQTCAVPRIPARLRVAVFDTETTGIPQAKGPLVEIIEVAAVIVDLDFELLNIRHVSDTREVHDYRCEASQPNICFETLVNPSDLAWREASLQALQVNGLTRAELSHAPDARTAGGLLRRWLVEHRVNACGSWGAFFDFSPVLLSHRNWLHFDPSQHLLCYPILLPCLKVCFNQDINPHGNFHDLQAACEWAAVPIPTPAHTARADAQAAATLLMSQAFLTFYLQALSQHFMTLYNRFDPFGATLTRAQAAAKLAGGSHV